MSFIPLAPKWVWDLISCFAATVAYGLAVERQGEGPAKKSEVIAAIKKHLEDPDGLQFPSVLVPYEDVILGILVEAAVYLMNRLKLSDFLDPKSKDSSTK